MNTKDLELPEFLLAEYPIKNNSINDQRLFIVHKGITLIEVIPHDEIISVVFESVINKQFSFFEEEYTLAYHTNNSSYYNVEEIELLNKAWYWFREYLVWEDTQ